MKASLNWIKDLLPQLRAPWTQVVDRMNASGVAVDAAIDQAASLEGVVVGEVKRLAPHPNADKLRLATVFDGETELEVVCGAPNVAEGQKVAFAKLGAKLPNGITIAAREIRGVPSSGMICSEAELGLSDDASGILVLPPRVRPGSPVARQVGRDDVVLEIDPPANRPDVLSHLGLARELAAIYRLPRPAMSLRVKEQGLEGETAGDLAKIEIRAAPRCARYVARVIRGVKIGPSPSWVVRRLESVGLRSISNVVDATNLVLLELGHPLHAFDLAKLNGGRIVVRTAKEGEKLTTIDGVERTLDPDDLVIADAAVPVAIAGVMGGQGSEVGEGTVDVLLESAYFEPRGVRRTSKRHGLHTEASHRFERGADHEMLDVAADRCAMLITDLAGGRILPGRLDVTKRELTRRVVPIRPERASLLLGRPVDKDEVRALLSALGLKKVAPPRQEKKKKLARGAKAAAAPSGTALHFEVPSARVDLTEEVDLIEEVARLAGYDSIPTVMPANETKVWQSAPPKDPLRRVRGVLVSEGYHEAISLAFNARSHLQALGHDLGQAVWIANPLGEESALMRTSLLPSLLRAAALNQSHLRTDVRLFEVGTTFEWGKPPGELPIETQRVAVILRGRRDARTWANTRDAADVYDLKGAVEALLGAFRIRGARFVPVEQSWLHPRSSTRIEVGGATVGVLGELHPDVMRSFELEGPPVYTAELSVAALAAAEGKEPKFHPVAKHPSATRDLSFFIDRKIPAEQIVGAVEGAGAGHFAGVEIFDVYEGDKLPEGKRSVAISVLFQAEDRTLTDPEIESAQTHIVRALETLGAQIRDR